MNGTMAFVRRLYRLYCSGNCCSMRDSSVRALSTLTNSSERAERRFALPGGALRAAAGADQRGTAAFDSRSRCAESRARRRFRSARPDRRQKLGELRAALAGAYRSHTRYPSGSAPRPGAAHKRAWDSTPPRARCRDPLRARTRRSHVIASRSWRRALESVGSGARGALVRSPRRER